MGTCFITRNGAISKNYVYLDGNKYTIQKGSFPGVSANALPLDGYVKISYGSPTAALGQQYTKYFTKNGVNLLVGNCNGANTNYGDSSAYVSFISAYGFDATKLASADTSEVTVNYWLHKE